MDDLGTILIEEERLTENYTRVPNTILRHPDLSPGAKLCYAMLLSYAHHNNACFPGQERLARDIGGGVRSVYRYLKELEAFHLLRVTRRGLGKTNVYVLAKWVESRSRSAILATPNPSSAKTADLDRPAESDPDPPKRPGEKDSEENDLEEKKILSRLGDEVARLLGNPRAHIRMTQKLARQARERGASVAQLADALAWVKRTWREGDGEDVLFRFLDHGLRR